MWNVDVLHSLSWVVFIYLPHIQFFPCMHIWVNHVFTCHGLPLTSCEAQICTLKLQSHYSGQSANVLGFSDVTPNTKSILASSGVSHMSFFKMLKKLEGNTSFTVISDFNLKGETAIIVNFMLSVQKREIQK